MYLYDERSDPVAARELLRDVVALHPRYAPAVARLCESNLLVGDIAEAVRYCEKPWRSIRCSRSHAGS